MFVYASLSPEEQEAVKALRYAIKVEQNGLITYIKLARKTKDITGKNMLIGLARDEFYHMITLEKQLESIVENHRWIKVDIEESEIEKLVPKISEYIGRIKGERALSEEDALQVALSQEKQSIDFYKEQYEKAQTPEAKEMFRRLIEMEESHYNLVLAQLDYIKKTGFWFGIPEFTTTTKEISEKFYHFLRGAEILGGYEIS